VARLDDHDGALPICRKVKSFRNKCAGVTQAMLPRRLASKNSNIFWDDPGSCRDKQPIGCFGEPPKRRWEVTVKSIEMGSAETQQVFASFAAIKGD
jgi:hypothetical protein